MCGCVCVMCLRVGNGWVRYEWGGLAPLGLSPPLSFPSLVSTQHHTTTTTIAPSLLHVCVYARSEGWLAPLQLYREREIRITRRGEKKNRHDPSEEEKKKEERKPRYMCDETYHPPLRSFALLCFVVSLCFAFSLPSFSSPPPSLPLFLSPPPPLLLPRHHR